MQPKKTCSILICLCITSVLFLTAGIVLIGMWEVLYDYIVKGNLILKPDSPAFKIWIKNPLPLTLKLFVYNWTNPQEIYKKGEKSNITWNANNTVTFKHLKKWYFDPERSNGSLYDAVTSINPVALSAAYATRTWSYMGRKTFSITFDAMISSIYITKSVGNVLFDGYDDPLMNIANTFPFLAGNNFPPMDKFGWFYGRNGSEDYEGSFNMDTGVWGQLGELYEWKYANHTPYYRDKCGGLSKVSAGEFFPTNLRNDTLIKFFSADLCRYVELEFEKEETVHGITGYKYSANDRFLDNGTKIPENKCFCDGDCMPSGALNVSACRYGSPAFVSLPHFYKADPYYRDIVEGVAPDAEKHDFFMTFEPGRT
ncbi:hypothetical protein NQ318_011643 [Aromia moschata]|uniref:Uncharacterized protein n=1 Tax=Aromia moschata TaxID=1265417 RepID=A0AAV8Z8P4_9CUCU|nr:hypothetical protein NQ318_011643 [Aromia moschata]